MLSNRRCVGVFRSWGSSDVGFDPAGDSAFLRAVRGVVHSRRFAKNGPQAKLVEAEWWLWVQPELPHALLRAFWAFFGFLWCSPGRFSACSEGFGGV